MSIQLPDDLRRALQVYEVTCLVTEINHEAAILAKLPAAEQRRFRNAPVRYGYEMALYDEGPVICLAMAVLDNPANPVDMESFLNVANQFDLALARKLAGQEHLTLHFLDERLDHTLSKRVRHRNVARRELEAMITQALDHLSTLSNPDWYAARQRFMREVPRG